MEFIREVWFVLQNVPSLAQRYQSQSFWAAIFFALSVLSLLLNGLVKRRLTDRGVALRTVLIWTGRASMTLTALVFVLAGIDLIKTRLPFNDVVCSEIATDAYYYVPQSKNYELVERYKCENRSNSSIRNFAPVQDGYFEEIPNWTVQYKLLGRTPIGLVVRTQGRPERRTNYFAGGERIFYLYRASAEFEPPLPSGAGFDLVYKLAAGGVPVEAAAFTNNGTLFARGVEYDTLKFHVTIHAPPGFEVRLRDWGVIDPSGRLEADETRRQPEPTITGSGGLLQWRVSLARRHLRYMLRYAFEAYGLQ